MPAELKTYTQDLDGVYYALQDFSRVGGGSTIAMAAHLYELGVRGKRKDSHCCPVANWLRLLFGENCDPEVDEGMVRVNAFTVHPNDWLQPPDEVDDLISAVDNGGYSDLIEENPSHAAA